MEIDKVEFIEKMKARTKQIGLEAISISRSTIKNDESRVVLNQFVRSALSVGANYRAACRARSRAEFFAKLSITVEEADEVEHWCEILEEAKMINFDMTNYKKEVREVLSKLSNARKNTK